jgi:hypothetical protein
VATPATALPTMRVSSTEGSKKNSSRRFPISWETEIGLPSIP